MANDTKNLEQWVKEQDFKSTKDMEVPEKLIDQVIGQEKAVEVVKKAAEQKRHVMLIGDPGTGKSMLAKAMTEFLPKEDLQDIMVYPNPEDSNMPKIRVVPASKGKEIVTTEKIEARKRKEQKSTAVMIIVFMIIGLTLMWVFVSGDPIIFLFGIIAAAMIFMILRSPIQRHEEMNIPKLLVGHNKGDMPPFVDATASHSGALLGDVRHDPFQSAGLETPPNQLVEAGAIHRAHKGVLYIDEINTLRLESQQNMLTAIQEKTFSITGQSERSFGAMVKTEPVPCDFILVAAGNLDAVQGMHPALRSRIRGYGYEIYMNNKMDDTEENRMKLVRFIAQEVKKDGKIPHFDKSAVAEILHEAQRKAGQKDKFTLRLRELGGLIRAAGDIAVEEKSDLVTVEHVLKAKKAARSLEQQVADHILEAKGEYRMFKTNGAEVGVVNGLAVISADPSMSEYSGVVMPIVAEVTPSQSRSEGKIIATGKLGDIAKEAVLNVSALIKKFTGKDIASHDVHIQFVGTYEGVEGDSASVSVATAVISALENVAIDQSVAMTGSLSIRGGVLPVGGVTAKIEAAATVGLKKVLIPRANMKDVLIEDKYKDEITIVPVDTLNDVLKEVIVGAKRETLLEKLAKFAPRSSMLPVPKTDADANANSCPQ